MDSFTCHHQPGRRATTATPHRTELSHVPPCQPDIGYSKYFLQTTKYFSKMMNSVSVFSQTVKSFVFKNICWSAKIFGGSHRPTLVPHLQVWWPLVLCCDWLAGLTWPPVPRPHWPAQAGGPGCSWEWNGPAPCCQILSQISGSATAAPPPLLCPKYQI